MSVASDLTAAQLVLGYWTDKHVWIVSLVLLLFLLSVNAFSVGAYGELGEQNPIYTILHSSQHM